MSVRNQGWYNAQSTRRYPLDDNATASGDLPSGARTAPRLPDDVLVDCHLRWPEAAGQYAFVGGVTVTPKLVTVLFLAASAPDSATGFTPLAAISLVRPVASNVYHPVRAIYPGTGGFVVFGDLTEDVSVRFSTPQQGLLAPKCARPHRKLPIPTLRKAGRAVGLQDLVRIIAGPDLEILKEEISIGGRVRDALVLRLVGETPDRNPLAQYVGPCGNRPESGNCNREGVATINGVGPDCDGNIDITFAGLAAGPYQSCGSEGAGVTLDQPLDLSDVCTDGPLSRAEGEDLCATSSSSSSVAAEAPENDEEEVSSESETTLPFQDDFADSDCWTVVSGAFELNPGLAYMATDLSRRNVALCNCVVTPPLDKRVMTTLRLDNTGARHNGGVVLNYRTVNGHPVYFQVGLDRDANLLQILRFNGNQFVMEAAVLLSVPLSYEHSYALTAAVSTSGAQVAIAAAIEGVTVPAWPAASVSVTTSRYLPAVGQLGLGTDHSAAIFETFRVEGA